MHIDADYPLDQGWVLQELVPFLQNAFGKRDRYDGFTEAHWANIIEDAENTLNDFTVYEDFPSTVERMRLMLVNEDIMTTAEIKDFGWIREEVKFCVQVFIRHMMRHGVYDLHSLGNKEDPDLRRRKNHDDDYIFGGKFAGKRPGTRTITRSRGAYRGVDTLRGRSHTRASNRSRSPGTFESRPKRKTNWSDDRRETSYSQRQNDGPRYGNISMSGGAVQPPQGAYNQPRGAHGYDGYPSTGGYGNYPRAGGYGGGYQHQVHRHPTGPGYMQQPSRPGSGYGYQGYHDRYVLEPPRHIPRPYGMRPSNQQWVQGYNDYGVPEQQYYPPRYWTDGASDYPLTDAFTAQALLDDEDLPAGAVEFRPGAGSHK